MAAGRVTRPSSIRSGRARVTQVGNGVPSAVKQPAVAAVSGAGGTTTAPLSISGAVHNAATGYPVAGVRIEAAYLEPASSEAGTAHRQLKLGSGSSAPDGSYLVAWIESEAVSQHLCLLASCSDARFVLTVASGRQTLLETPPMPAAGRKTVVELAVEVPRQAVPANAWSQLGARATKAGVNRVNALVDQLLVVPLQQSLVSDWPLTLRQNAAMQLETAFLDPRGILDRTAPLPTWLQLAAKDGLERYAAALGDGITSPEVKQAYAELSQKVTQFPTLDAVDWVMDSGLLGRNPAEAITVNQAKYFGTWPQLINGPIWFNPEVPYRDYLRGQWTTMITLVEYVQPHALTVAQAEQQLRSRFHQDFSTQDTTWQSANEILITILTEILTALPGASFGFGLTPAQIPARGAAAARAYLDTLVGLTGVSAQELSLRYRTDFTRPDTSMSSPVWENIYTLWGFYRDSFQSVVDPSHTDPDVLGQPIIPDKMQGKAPYFLEYDEWLLLQQPIPFENYFQVRPIFQMTVGSGTRQMLQNFAASSDPDKAITQYYLDALQVNDQLQKAYQFIDEGEYQAALDILGPLSFPTGALVLNKFTSDTDIAGEFANRRAVKVNSLADLQALITRWQVGDFSPDSGATFDQWLSFYQTPLACSLVYLAVFTLPLLSAQCSLALGDYPTAVRELGRSAYLLVGKASTADSYAWRDHYTNEWEGSWLGFPLYVAGNLPYTVDTEARLQSYPSFYDDDSLYWGAGLAPDAVETNAGSLIPGARHAVEAAFYRLQMGGAMLEWADTLYRSDDQSSIARARELYKGVYYLHGAVPPINPTWNGSVIGTYFTGSINPAIASQLARAELGFTQIQAGLNFLGYTDDMVPSLRYSVLKQAADAFATEAKSTEQDFITSMGQIETATVENMKNAAMLRRAILQSQVAQQQTGIAQDQVTQGQILVTQVNQQIQAVQQQIADHDSFFGELGDYVSGMVGIVKGLPSFFTTGVGQGVAAEAGLGSADTAGLLGIGAGASTLAGFGAFYVASYMTMSSMASAQNQRAGQLNNLENQNLPSAQAQLDIAKRSVTIAGLQQQIAQCDADLATQLLAFAEDRYLNIEFWSRMAALFQRILRQYLDLATRTAWLAQRALSYEQNRPGNIIGMDYYPAAEQGAGGADQLQLDLADLEGQYLSGLQEMIPVKYTVSLSRDFPLQFGQLRKTGQCLIQTSEETLHWAYPGTYGYRIIAATPRLTRIAGTAPVRGLLSNTGVSQISVNDGSMLQSIRPTDALPISEFDIDTSDMQVYGLPGGTLMQFEGSGIDTVWQLQFPAVANPSGLADVADVLITFNLRAQFSPSLQASRVQQMPASITKMIVMSAYKQQLPGLADLIGKASQAEISFDLTELGLPAQEKNRTLNNLAVLLIGGTNAATVKATVKASGHTIPVTLADGTAYSNAPPVTDAQSTVPASPLNVLSGTSADSSISVGFDKTTNAGVDFTTVVDVLLAVDYTADV